MLESPEKVRSISDEKEIILAEIRRQRCINCCGYIAAILFIHAGIALIIAFTVFKLRFPIIRIGKVTVDEKLELTNGNNLTLLTEILVENPNYAAFDFGSMNTTLFYRSVVIGESHGPPGRAKARRTVNVSMIMDIMPDRILAVPEYDEDTSSGLINVTVYSKLRGRINVFIIEKRMKMKMNCTLSYNVTSKAIERHKCKRKVKM